MFPLRWQRLFIFRVEYLEDRTAPSVTDLIRLPDNISIGINEAISTAVNQLAVSISDPLQPDTVNDTGNWELRSAGADTVFNTADDTFIGLSLVSPYATGTSVTLNPQGGTLPVGLYQFKVFSQAVKDTSGNLNDEFVRQFQIVLPSTTEVEPNNDFATARQLTFTEGAPSSGFFTSSIAIGTINPAGESDYWKFAAQAGDKVVLDLEATSGNVNPRFLVIDEAGATLVDSNTWGTFGNPPCATNRAFTVPVTGSYYVKVLSADAGNSTGDYQFRLDLGRTVQLEPYDFNNANNTTTGAGSIPLKFTTNSSDHLIATIAGNLHGQESIDYFAIGRLEPGSVVNVASRTITVSNLTYRIQVVGATAGVVSDNDGSQLDARAIATITQSDDYFVKVDAISGTGIRGQYLIDLDIQDVVSPTVTWINSSSGDWNIASNWSTGVVPRVNDDVMIPDKPGTITITHSSGTHTIKSLSASENFTLSGGTLTITGQLRSTATVNLTGGILANATVRFGTTLTGNGGTVSGVTLNGNTLLTSGL